MKLSSAPTWLGCRFKILSLNSGPHIFTCSSRDSHESLQIFVVIPLPMAFPKFYRNRFLPCIIPLHPWEQVAGRSTIRKFFLWQYLARSTLASKLSEPCEHRLDPLIHTHWKLKARHWIGWDCSEDRFQHSQFASLGEAFWWPTQCSLSDFVHNGCEEVSLALSKVLSCWQEAGDVEQKNIVSSANSKWLTCGLPCATLTPCKVPSLAAFLHKPDRTSPHRIKR